MVFLDFKNNFKTILLFILFFISHLVYEMFAFKVRQNTHFKIHRIPFNMLTPVYNGVFGCKIQI